MRPIRTMVVSKSKPRARVLGQDVLEVPKQKTAGSARRIAHGVTELRIHQGADHLDDVSRSSELAVFARGADLREQMLVQLTLTVVEGLPVFLALSVNLLENLVGRKMSELVPSTLLMALKHRDVLLSQPFGVLGLASQ